MPDYDLIIIGGGLAGLTTAIELSQAGVDVLVVEKREYPFHKVCGEYLSREVVPYLQSVGADVKNLQPALLQKLRVTTTHGKELNLPLDLGGVGISRYRLDHLLYQRAQQTGAEFLLGQTVTHYRFQENQFKVSLKGGDRLTSRMVVGSFGKRSTLDRELGRTFFQNRSPYMAVKYHVRVSFPADLIALHHFQGGYCGITKIEDDRYCLCYLTHRDHLKKYGDIKKMERAVLCQNPHLEEIFREAEFLYERPLVINEISFERKELVHHHAFMAGDAAGMIAPLFGNGMAMAIRAGYLLSQSLNDYFANSSDRRMIEKRYPQQWEKEFATRMWLGQKFQTLFGHQWLTDGLIKILRYFPKLARLAIRYSHGAPLKK